MAVEANGGRSRATEGPLVADEELDADLEHVAAGLRHERVDGWETELFEQGTGDPILFVPILAHVEVIYAGHIVGRGGGAIGSAEFAAAHTDRRRSLVMIGFGLRHKVPPTGQTTAL